MKAAAALAISDNHNASQLYARHAPGEESYLNSTTIHHRRHVSDRTYTALNLAAAAAAADVAA